MLKATKFLCNETLHKLHLLPRSRAFLLLPCKSNKNSNCDSFTLLINQVAKSNHPPAVPTIV